MKQIKRLFQMLALVMVLSVLLPSIIPLSKLSVAQAATVKLNKKTLTLEVGKSETLKITGTKSKITWSSSNKAIATVSTKGKITAKKAGKATITATVSKKKYSCTITVKKAVNKYIKNAPFSAREATLGKIKFVYPKDWTNNVNLEDGSQLMTMLYPSNADILTGTSKIEIIITETAEMAKPELSDVKEFIESPEIQMFLAAQYGVTLDASISKLKFSEFKATLGTAIKMEFETAATEGGSQTMKQCVYILFLDNYTFVLYTTDIGDGKKLKLTEIAEYMVNSISLVK